VLRPAETAGTAPAGGPPAHRPLRLAAPASAVLLGAADTYVVVLALPEIMAGVGLSVDELARAAPIVTGFLLGYVVVLPVAGRVSDVAGRVPVLTTCLLGFALGSLVTASATTLPVAVAGRTVQGLGAGGLVPPTLALVADLWAERDRGPALGVVGAAQELGAVLGPLAGAAVLAVADWRAIFWINLGAALVLAAALPLASGATGGPHAAAGRRTLVATAAMLVPAVLGAVALALVLRPPDVLATSVTLGTMLVPVTGDSTWLSPLALAAAALLAGAAIAAGVRVHRVQRADTERGATAAEVDLVGALLLGAALAGVVLTFAGAETTRSVVDDRWLLYLGVAAVAAAGFAVRQRQARSPLVPRGALAARGARAAIAANALVGVALVAVIVDVPVFARVTRFPTSQLGAALVLLEFLAALPVGALAGGWLVGPGAGGLGPRVPARAVAAGGLALAALALAGTRSWDERALYGAPAQVLLAVAGLGIGLAIAPTNAVLLSATPPPVHGLVSALAVLARTAGMLVGLSVLTAVGLRVFAARQAAIGSPFTLCPRTPGSCPAYEHATLASVVGELQAVFTGACLALVAAVVVVILGLREEHG
jgi:MFS family permease